MTPLAQAAARLLNAEIISAAALNGGDLSQVARLKLRDGRQVIVKNGPAPKTEAAMLRAIKAAGAPAPRVLAADAAVLVMEPAPERGGLSAAWADLGEALARLHRAEGLFYGWPADYAFGSVAILNQPAESWPAFWVERRLLCHLAHAPAGLGRRLETLAADLPNRLPGQPAKALLHGDLWSGNILAADGRISGLIDPACYYGHAEVDLAMLSLFDHPPPGFYAAYGGLEPGYAERSAIYKLWPALVHLRLFGGGYRPMVERFLDACRV